MNEYIFFSDETLPVIDAREDRSAHDVFADALTYRYLHQDLLEDARILATNAEMMKKRLEENGSLDCIWVGNNLVKKIDNQDLMFRAGDRLTLTFDENLLELNVSETGNPEVAYSLGSQNTALENLKELFAGNLVLAEGFGDRVDVLRNADLAVQAPTADHLGGQT